jgi:thioredoxin reductase (NADPH)
MVQNIWLVLNENGAENHSYGLFHSSFGLTPKLGPNGKLGIRVKNAIKVDALDYQTNIPGFFCDGDVNTYQVN